MGNPFDVECSFCHKHRQMVDKLIGSPSDCPRVLICNECIRVCNEIMRDSPVDPPPPAEFMERLAKAAAANPDPRFRLVISDQVSWRGKVLLLVPAKGLVTRFARAVAWVLQVPLAIVEPTPRC